jgi:hypothetical protein
MCFGVNLKETMSHFGSLALSACRMNNDQNEEKCKISWVIADMVFVGAGRYGFDSQAMDFAA